MTCDESEVEDSEHLCVKSRSLDFRHCRSRGRFARSWLHFPSGKFDVRQQLHDREENCVALVELD